MVEVLPWQQIITGVFAIVGSIAGAMTAYWINRHKFAREKAWEQRTQVYKSIISKLNRAVDVGSTRALHINPLHSPIVDSKMQAWDDWFWRLVSEALELFDDNEIFISDNFAENLRNVRSRIFSASSEVDTVERQAAAVKVIKDVLPILRRQAKDEIKYWPN